MKETRINKHLFTWAFSFLLGLWGADRFARGQIGLGILKLLTAGGFGIWAFVDWIIAVSNAYMGRFRDVEEFVFVYGHYADPNASSDPQTPVNIEINIHESSEKKTGQDVD